MRKKSDRGTGRRGIFFSVSLLSAAAVLLALQGAAQSLLSHPRFLVTEIELVWPQEPDRPVERYRLHPAASIFRADLRQLTDLLSRRHPAAEVLSVRRILPNRLMASLRMKRPIGQLKISERYYPVSREGRILLEGQPAALANLPVLLMEGARRPFRPGETFGHPQFSAAGKLLEGILRQGGIAGRAVALLRCRGTDFTLVLDSGLEIRFDARQLEQEWFRLGELLTRKPEILDQAGYIDLRFGNPVIGGAKKGKGSR